MEISMRSVSSRAVLWMSVLCVVLALFAFESLTFAQSAPILKHKVAQQTLSRQPVASGLKLALAPPAVTRPGGADGPQLTTDTWTGAVSADWSNTLNWALGSPSGQNVLINLTAGQTATDDDFSVSIGTLTLSNAVDSVTVENNITLTVGGNISNNGTITLASGGNNTVLDLATSATLSGSGTLVLGSGGPNLIGGASGVTLTNTSTIEGGGSGSNDQVGEGQIAINNSTGGIINANVSGTNLYVNPGAASTNSGTLEATNGGTLVLDGSSWNNAGGTISAAAGSVVDLANGVSITGGTLNTTGSGVVEEGSSQTISLTNVTNSGTYDILNNSTTQVSGTITNNGTINLESGGNNTELDLTASTTLSGSGTVVLGGGGPNFIGGASGTTLTNDSTIVGGGSGSNDQVGIGQITLVNSSTGVINANVSGTNLYVDPVSSATNTNAGTLEATNGGTLVLDGSSWTQTGAGNITAANGSTVVLTNGVSLTGGTLNSTGTGVVEEGTGQSVSLSNITITGTYDILNNSATQVSGTITNNGTINLQSGGNNTALDLSGNTTLTGSGTVVLGTGGPNFIGTGTSGLTLTIDQTISGVGNVGNGQITTLVNNSTIDANISPTVSGAVLYIQPSSGGLTNSSTGVLEATNGGRLVLYGGSVTNNGIIEAVGSDSSGNASTVELTNGVSITGGTLTTSGAGVVEDVSGQTVYLTNVTNKGTYDILNNATTVVNGTITNNGTINLESTGNNTELELAASTTLTGTGSVVLGSGGPNFIGGTGTLTIDQTISGAGNVGEGQITLLNNSTVEANVNGGTLILQPGAASTNKGTLEATNGGTLEIYGSSWTQSGSGNITAASGTVVLTAGTSISGGVLNTSGTGVIEVGSGQTVFLTTLTNSGTFDILNNATTEVSGTITNNGTINLQSGGNNTALERTASTTMKGKGSVVLGDGGPNFIGGATGTVLTNDETIEGAGNIGEGQIKIANTDIIDANVAGATLILQAGAASTNTKTLEATNGSVLEFYGSSWKQTGAGTITAATGSTVVLTAGTSISGGVLTTSGTGVIETGSGQTIFLSNITNDGTYDILNNATTEVSGTITNNGTINLQSGGNNTALELTASTTLDGTGSLVLGSGGPNFIGGASGSTFTKNSTNKSVGKIGGVQITITNNGTLEALNGSLAIDPISGGLTNYNSSTNTMTGGTFIANGGNLTFAGSATGITTLSAAVVEENGGQLIDTNGNINALASLTSITSTGSLVTDVNFTDAGSFSNAGSLTILSGTTFNVGSLAQISGNTLTAGTYVLDANLGITGTAQNITTNAANLSLAGGTIENTSNSTNALANLAVNSGSLTLANNANFTTVGNFNNTGTLAVDKGSTFTVTGTLAQISGSTLASGSFVLGGTLQLGSGISITTNAANLTLEGGELKSGTANALAALATNTGSLTIAGDTSYTTPGSLANSGAVDVQSGSTMKIGGTGNAYNQSGGTTTVDGTLTGSVNTTGGTLLGSGTLSGNVSNGGTISAGDAGVAGLLKITGTYTQLSSGTLNATIGGTAVGTEYSELKVTGAASLSGTLTVNLINGFVPKVGAKFTILSAKSITGTFTTQYIVINGSEYFAVSYTTKGVVLTVDSGVPPAGNGNTAQGTLASRNNDEKSGFQSGLRRRIVGGQTGGEFSRVASTLERGQGYWGTVARAYKVEGTLRSNYLLPELPTWRGTVARPVAFPTNPVDGGNSHNNLRTRVGNNWTPNPQQVVSPRLGLAGGFQNNQAHGTELKRLLPLQRSR